jgi:hypothetical protein
MAIAMTLITYPMRVHFADYVLEEVLRSELENLHPSVVILIYDEDHGANEVHERVIAGIPPDCLICDYELSRDKADEQVELLIVQECAHASNTAIVAFGSANAISVGRRVRSSVQKQLGAQVAFIAVPGIDGLPDPSSGFQNPRSGSPSILVCDASVTLCDPPELAMRSAVTSLVRCVESYLSTAFNPPADGIALDGFNRCIGLLPRVSTDCSLAIRRDLMAASLNGAMAQEKGIGPTRSLSVHLVADCPKTDPADISRLILPGMLEAMPTNGDRSVTLERNFGSGPKGLGNQLRNCLAALPMAASLAEAGVVHDRLIRAAQKIAGDNAEFQTRALAVLESIY